MKILYIVPSINKEGGVEKVLSIKANYLVEKLDYEVHILTQNGGNISPFYSFSKKIQLHDMNLKGKAVNFFLNYKNQLYNYYVLLNPDIIVVADNGLKAFLSPFLFRKNRPIIFECHGSKFIELKKSDNSFIARVISKFSIAIKEFAAGKFTRFVALSNKSLKEWNLNNGLVITNPNIQKTETKAILESKKVIAVARHSYEKGLDRLLVIWKKVVETNPGWILEIYGSIDKNIDLKQLASELNISNSVHFYEPVKNIADKYKDASVLVMTSRSEGFGLVLIEAMEAGLPVVAYDCPCGPRSIIDNDINGFLVEDNNADSFAEKLVFLMNNNEFRKAMGTIASESVAKYNVDKIMSQWHTLFLSLKKS